MKSSFKKVSLSLVVIIVFVLVLASCSGGNTGGGEAPAPAPAPATDTDTDNGDADAVKAPVIGISTGMLGSSWRNEMATAIEDLADQYKAEGLIADYKVVNNVTGGDATEQANIIRDFINEGVDIILVDPNSADSLNGVLYEAVDAGITVMSFDSTLNISDIPQVTLDQYMWMNVATEMLCEMLGGSGNVIEIYGIEGHAGNVLFMEGTQAALDKYPDVKRVASASGAWDQVAAKEATLQILGSGQQIDGIITHPSMGYGCLTAFIDSNKLPKAVIGDPGTAFFKEWKKLIDEGADFQAITMPHPPGISATGLKIALRLYQGKEFKDGILKDGAILYMPTTKYTNETFNDGWEAVKDQPDDYFIDEIMTDQAADDLFK